MLGEGPSFSRKVWFWVILGMSSVFFAEVTVGSQPFPFFDPFAILVAVPLYTLHILVLATIVVRGRKVTLSSLFVAGILFGLYEAYITKVIWDPYWEFGTTVYFAEIAVAQTVILILWYHNFFAFIIPLAVGEALCTNSSKVFSALPARVRRMFQVEKMPRTLLALGIVFGMFQAASGLGPSVSPLSVGASGLLLFAVYQAYRMTGGARHSIDALLPSERQFRVLLALLVLFYAIMTPALLPENLPGPVGHAAVLLMYAGAILLLRAALRRNGRELAAEGSVNADPALAQVSVKHIVLFLAVYAVSATVLGFVQPVAGVAALFMHIAGVCVGVLILAKAARASVRPREVVHNA